MGLATSMVQTVEEIKAERFPWTTSTRQSENGAAAYLAESLTA